MAELLFKISANSVEDVLNQVEELKKAHPEDVLKFEVTILSDYHSN